MLLFLLAIPSRKQRIAVVELRRCFKQLLSVDRVGTRFGTFTELSGRRGKIWKLMTQTGLVLVLKKEVKRWWTLILYPLALENSYYFIIFVFSSGLVIVRLEMEL